MFRTIFASLRAGSCSRARYCLFPAEVAALYLMHPSRNTLEYRAGWGGTGMENPVIAPESCWALRRGQVYRYEPPHDGLPCEHVTVEPPEHGSDSAGLFQAADMALYRAQHRGRNRVGAARAVTQVVSASAPDGPREIESEII